MKYAFMIFLILFSLFLFRGHYNHGIEFDEVYRTNNIIPLINDNAEPYNQSILNIKLFGSNIPLMYKEYISTIFAIEYLPLKFFKDYAFGLRLLYLIYFIVFVLGFFIIVSRYTKTDYAYALTLMAITSPFLYPDVTFGFVSIEHFLFIALSLYLFCNYFINKKNILYLFFASFIFSFSANLVFYNMWIIVALVLCSLIFFPRHWIYFLSSFKRITVVCAGFFLGLFNYFVYNISNGFPTIKPLFLKIFVPQEYNKNPIDFKPTQPLLEDITYKFSTIIKSFLGEYYFIYIILFLIILLIYIILLFKIIKIKRFQELKIYYFPLFVFILAFIFIIISPNTTRREHYARLVPLFEISFLMPLLLIEKIHTINRPIKILIIMLPISLITLNCYVSNMAISLYNKTHGEGLFSPAIFDLNEYIKKQHIPSENIVHLEWGMYAQLYFLQKGEYKINELVFPLLGAENEKARLDTLYNYFTSNKIKNIDKLYFPIYNNHFKDISMSFLNFTKSYDGELSIEKVFYEKNGDEVFCIYRLDNVPAFIDRIKNRQMTTMGSNLLDSQPGNQNKAQSTVDFSKGEYEHQIEQGWYGLEENSFRWISKKANLILDRPGDVSDKEVNGVYRFKLHCAAVLDYFSQKEIEVTVGINKKVIGKKNIAKNGGNDIELTFHESLPEKVQIYIEVDKTFIPKEKTHSSDARELGLVVFSVSLEKV